MEYAHDPLPVGDFLRVLTISHDETTGEPIVGFDPRSLRQCATLRYTAISYAWEAPAPVRRLRTTDGRYLWLSETLSAFFDTLKERRIQTLWIDALCIDQSNIAERNHQVGLMGEIYKKADHVLIWLGLGDDVARQGLTMFENGESLNFRQSKSLNISHLIHLLHWFGNRFWGNIFFTSSSPPISPETTPIF